MSDDDVLTIDGASVRFVPREDGRLQVTVDDRDIGSIEPNPSGFAAFSASGDALTRPSRWGGRVTARFGSKELAVRALLGDA